MQLIAAQKMARKKCGFVCVRRKEQVCGWEVSQSVRVSSSRSLSGPRPAGPGHRPLTSSMNHKPNNTVSVHNAAE